MNRPYIDPLKKTEMLRQATQPVNCKILSDIKKALETFLKPVSNQEVQMVVQLPWSDTDSSGTDTIQGTSRDTPLYTLLVEGMNVVKKRIDFTEKLRDAIKAAEEEDELPSNMVVWGINDQVFRVDQLIRAKLGGKRVGLRIQWTVEEGVFEFDPYTKKLYEVTQ